MAYILRAPFHAPSLADFLVLSRMNAETVLTNTRLVARDDVIAGSVVVRDGRLTSVDDAPSALPSAIDLEGDYLLPGLVELHTDNLEHHFVPRPGVRWPSLAATLSHDAQIAAAGITTVFDALFVGDIHADSARRRDLADMADTLAEAQDGEMLRAEHRLHVRCEVACKTLSELFEPFESHPLVGLVSLMDHTPGQRQFQDLAHYRSYYKEKWHVSDSEIDAFIADQDALAGRYAMPNRRRIAVHCRERGLPLASHDDATAEHVAEAKSFGVGLAEFPTTIAAAIAARAEGIEVIAGAPNLVRGESHSGNV
ncbi:MAG: alpha-D-ribose 1-methylphosphonate 5-triphosphate diphosphatase, partial [Alphaproteobacteria bacterium]|nr:alpha-D-ribose 1-methylphosphonate 5-triphosphate diphosphatase [Alphaproteobacteria bacterium]